MKKSTSMTMGHSSKSSSSNTSSPRSMLLLQRFTASGDYVDGSS